MVSKQTVTLANSIVGVSVLAMPFCFKQCGIILATLMLIVGAVITRMVCYFLLKAGLITRRRTYEMLAWDTFGQGGKFMVEISIIGFLFGTLIAFFVVMGDLGPEILTEIFDVQNNKSLRIVIMAALGLFVALPLGLLRNIDSLSIVSTASVLFYVFLVFKILSEGIGPLFNGSYLERIDYWRPAGVLQCIPIFSMALSCQTQIFGIYESLPEPTLQKMNEIIKQAVNICTVFYFCVGFFGYIAFCHQSFGGNILMSFSASWSTQLIKTCFLMSIVFSVPLVVFPCRASLHSLIFRRDNMHHSLHDVSTNYIPDIRLKILTVGIISTTLVVGVLIPNIELVLGLVGSTTGTVICIIFPSIMFIRVTSKQTTERLLAQVLFFTGVVMMVVSTYATLYAVDQAVNDPLPDQLRVTEIIRAVKTGEDASSSQLLKKDAEVLEKVIAAVKFEKFMPKNEQKQIPNSSTKKARVREDQGNVIEVEIKAPVKMKDSVNSQFNLPEKRPPPAANKEEKPEVKQTVVKENVVKSPTSSKPQRPPQESFNEETKEKLPGNDNHPRKQADDSLIQQNGPGLQESIKAQNQEVQPDNQKASVDDSPPPAGSISQPDKKLVPEQQQEVRKVDGVEKKDVVEKDVAAVLLKKLEQHEENQKKFLEEQRQVLAELKEHHAQDVQKQKEDEVKVQEHVPEQPKSKINENKPQDVNLVEKEEVAKQEQIIEKLSENIEKELQNVKLIEKLEEGLNKEIKKTESEPKFDNINLPEPVPPETAYADNPQLAPAVGKVLRRSEAPPPQDSVIIQKSVPVVIPPEKVILKPIPIRNSEKQEVKNPLPIIVNEVPEPKKAQVLAEKDVIEETNSQGGLVPKVNLEGQEPKKESLSKAKPQEGAKAPEPPKKVDRDM